MGPDRAAYACKLVNPKHIIPMHYGTFPLLTGTVAEFEKRLEKEKIPRDKLKVLTPGEALYAGGSEQG
jgi:L-ascorbate metabolism protein UlaG (beta-lactamase superfamily)